MAVQHELTICRVVLVEKELHGSTIFGIKQLKITSNIEDNMDLHHRVRIMTFKTQDLDDLVGCG